MADSGWCKKCDEFHATNVACYHEKKNEQSKKFKVEVDNLYKSSVAEIIKRDPITGKVIEEEIQPDLTAAQAFEMLTIKGWSLWPKLSEDQRGAIKIYLQERVARTENRTARAFFGNLLIDINTKEIPRQEVTV